MIKRHALRTDEPDQKVRRAHAKLRQSFGFSYFSFDRELPLTNKTILTEQDSWYAYQRQRFLSFKLHLINTFSED